MPAAPQDNRRLRSELARKLALAAVLAAITSVEYFAVLSHSFVNYDDDIYVTANPLVLAGLRWKSVNSAFTSLTSGNWLPLTWLSHMADCQLYGLNPAGHHMTNLLLHVLNVVLLFFVLNAATGAVWRSGFVAAVFALHPLNVQTVAWVAERKSLLSTALLFLTLLLYIRYARVPSRERYLPVVLLFALALMSKPMVVTIPFVLLLLDYWPLHRLRTQGPTVELTPPDTPSAAANNFPPVTMRRALFEKLPLALMSCACGLITIRAQRLEGYLAPAGVFSIRLRAENALVSYASYLKSAIWPTKLAVFYPFPKGGLPASQTLLAAGLLLLVTIGALRLSKKYGYISVGWFWFLGTLVPVIGLVQVGGQSMADRYAYLPLIGIFVAVVWGAKDAAERFRWDRKPVIVLAGCPLIALAVATHVQLGYWADSFTLFERAIQVTRDNSVAYNNLGEAFIRTGKFGEAVMYLKKAVEINPDDAPTQMNLGIALLKHGQIDESIAHLEEATRLDSQSFGAFNELGVAFQRKGLFGPSIACFRKSLEINPYYPQALGNLGNVLEQQGLLDDAKAAFARGLQNVDNAEMAAAFHCRLGDLLAEQGDTASAVAEFRQALRVQPGFAPAINGLEKVSKVHD